MAVSSGGLSSAAADCRFGLLLVYYPPSFGRLTLDVHACQECVHKRNALTAPSSFLNSALGAARSAVPQHTDRPNAHWPILSTLSTVRLPMRAARIQSQHVHLAVLSFGGLFIGGNLPVLPLVCLSEPANYSVLHCVNFTECCRISAVLVSLRCMRTCLLLINKKSAEPAQAELEPL